jgi:hypothetical protein
VIENIIVDVSFNQIGGVSTFCFLELVSKCKFFFLSLSHAHVWGLKTLKAEKVTVSAASG